MSVLASKLREAECSEDISCLHLSVFLLAQEEEQKRLAAARHPIWMKHSKKRLPLLLGVLLIVAVSWGGLRKFSLALVKPGAIIFLPKINLLQSQEHSYQSNDWNPQWIVESINLKFFIWNICFSHKEVKNTLQKYSTTMNLNWYNLKQHHVVFLP